MNKSLTHRPYGRFHYIPKLLAEKGHNVTILYLNYKNEPSSYDHINNVHCYTVSLFKSFGLGYLIKSCQLAKKINPDWIIGLSDIYFGILANFIAHKYNTRSLIDAYDNYESYIPWLKPLHFLWHRSLANADLVTAAGPGLAESMAQFRPDKPTHIIPMAADPQFPSYLTKMQCRSRLNLPHNKILIGYCGSIYQNRGIEQFFEATHILYKENNELQFIISGRLDPKIQIPTHIKWLGYLKDDELPLLVKSMNLLVVINKNNLFGNFSYPVKLYEAMATNIPIVATTTPPVKWIISDHPELLASSRNPIEIADKIKETLRINHIQYAKNTTWETVTDNFEYLLNTAL